MKKTIFLLLVIFAQLAHALESQTQVIKHGAFQYETGLAPDWVKETPFPASWPADFAERAPFRIWRLDEQDRINVGEYVDYAWQARNSKAIETAAQYSTDFDPSWQRLVIHELALKRGDKWLDRLKPEVITLARREQQFEGMGFTGRVSALIVLPDVQVDDVIRIRYSILGAHPLLKDVATASTFYLEHTNPILQRRIRVLGEKLRYEQSGSAPKAELVASDSLFSMALDQIKPRPWVDQMPGELSPWARVRVAPAASWEEVSRWAQELFSERSDSPEITALAKRFAHEAGRDTKKRALLATRYVQDHIRYFAVHLGESTHRPHPPKQVLELGYGDCKDKAQLLSLLLRALDVEAYPALVHSERGAGIVKELPNAGAFDHAIVMAKIDGKNYWLDATWAQQGGDLDSAGFPNFKNALVLAPGNKTLTAMQPAKVSPDSLEVTEHFDSTDPINTQLQVHTRWQGESAESMRASRANTGDEKIEESYKQSYARSIGTIDKASLEFNDDREHNLLKAEEHYSVLANAFWTRSGNYQFADFQATTLARVLQLPETAVRTQALAQQGQPLVLAHTLELKLPDDTELPELPKNVTITDPAFRFTRSAVKEQGVLKVRFRYESLSDRIEENIDAHLQHRREARDALSVRLSFRSSDPAADRKARMRKLLDSLNETNAKSSGQQP